MSIPDIVAKLARRLADLERRVENTVRHGKVAEVDADRKKVRLVIGKQADGTEQLSPWVSYAQWAGKLKIHTPPSVGQNMTLVSPGGDFEQGFTLPMTFNDGNPSPSSSADENLLTFGDVSFRVTDSSVTVSIGGHSVTLTASGTRFSGGGVGHDGTDIGKSHTHKDVRSGPDNSGTPNPGGP